MKHQKYLIDLISQYQQKNLAYGNSAHNTFLKYGKTAYSLRLSDKFQRLENLIRNPEIDRADESIADTLGDAITYTIMFAADMFYRVKYETEDDIPEDVNVNKTIEMLQLLTCCTEDEIKEMADEFSNYHKLDHASLVDVIYEMHIDENTTSTDYVLLAAYLIWIHNEGVISI